jgi:hypothetical protein
VGLGVALFAEATGRNVGPLHWHLEVITVADSSGITVGVGVMEAKGASTFGTGKNDGVSFSGLEFHFVGSHCFVPSQ